MDKINCVYTEIVGYFKINFIMRYLFIIIVVLSLMSNLTFAQKLETKQFKDWESLCSISEDESTCKVYTLNQNWALIVDRFIDTEELYIMILGSVPDFLGILRLEYDNGYSEKFLPMIGFDLHPKDKILFRSDESVSELLRNFKTNNKVTLFYKGRNIPEIQLTEFSLLGFTKAFEDMNVDESKINLNKKIMEATNSGNIAKVKKLIQLGADINTSNSFYETILHMAIRKKHTEMVKLLIAEGADINATNIPIEQTPLHVAARFGLLDIVDLLIKSGALVNAKTNFKETPLHDAAEKGHAKVIQLLIKHGAKLDMKDHKNRTPFDIAKENNQKHVIDLLRVRVIPQKKN